MVGIDAHILIVEDDEGIGANLQRAFSSETSTTSPGPARRPRPGRWHGERRPDLVLLDLGVPDGDGVDVCRALLVEQPALPIIILTARDTEIDVVVGSRQRRRRLRHQAVPTRASSRPACEPTSDGSRPARRRSWSVSWSSIGAHAAWSWPASAVDLRAKEFDLFACLAAAAGNVLRREDLMAEIWDEHWFGSTKTLDVTVSSLRRKLDDAKPRAVTITTLRGVGYRLERP